MVRYQEETGDVKSITEASLPSGTVQVEIPGCGLAWVLVGKLRPDGAPQAGPLSPEAMERVKEIKATLDEVHPRTLKEWEELLLRFARPEAEVVRWRLVANVYDLCTRGRRLSTEAKQDYYKVIVASSASSRDRALANVQLVAIKEEDAQEAVALYFNHRG